MNNGGKTIDWFKVVTGVICLIVVPIIAGHHQHRHPAPAAERHHRHPGPGQWGVRERAPGGVPDGRVLVRAHPAHQGDHPTQHYGKATSMSVQLPMTEDEARDWLARARQAIDLDEGSNDEEHDCLLEIMDEFARVLEEDSA